ncbi:MAG TPA: hypothetical protein DIT05_16880 [Morganella sp. (in: Bacteria)]|nr:hypothetical protein [Morganella sp. (in: enterobacteria)]
MLPIYLPLPPACILNDVGYSYEKMFYFSPFAILSNIILVKSASPDPLTEENHSQQEGCHASV